MADVLYDGSGQLAGKPVRYRDMGDGSWALVNDIGGSFADVATITRPDNATPYTGNDVVGAAAAALEFTLGPASGAEVIITGASLEIDVAAVPAGMTAFRLHLYNVTPPSARADNAAFDLPAGDRAAYLGYIDLGTIEDLGSTLFTAQDGLNKPVTLASASLFAYLTTVGAYTPTAQAVKKVTLHTVRP